MKSWILVLAAVSALAGWSASTASARIEHYLITVTASGPGKVTGSGDGGSFDCSNSTCSAQIRERTSITLTATPDEGAQFTGWGGACADFGSQTTCELQITGPKDATAGFGTPPPPPPPKVTLTIDKTGTGSGYVGGGGGIDCGPVCSNAFFPSSTVTLLAVADDGSTFAGWSGADCSGTGQCAFTIATDTQIIATFTHVDRQAPVIKTFSGTAALGEVAQLRYRVFDDSGRSRELLTVLHGKATVARVSVALGSVSPGQVYAARWKVPAKAARGDDVYCAVAIDAAGNQSKRSCSRFTVK